MKTFRRFLHLRRCLRLNPKFLFGAALFLAVTSQQAQPLPEKPAASDRVTASVSERDAVAIIIGEAGGEPYAGQVAVAAVLRRRNSTRGFYGLKNPVVAKASAKTVARAQKAWADSATSDPSKGATHFENVKSFGTPKWAEGKTPCAVIGNHTFFKL